MNAPLAEQLRRLLVGAIAALLVARSFAVSNPSDVTPAPLGGLFLTFGWFVVLFAATLWHAWARPGLRIGDWVALGLVVTAAIVALRAAIGTPNAWLAMLATWQWLALPIVYVLVRQLAADRFDSQGMLAAILATAVAALAANAIPTAASTIGYKWSETHPEVNLRPDGTDDLATAFDSAADAQRRAWSHDLLWLSLSLPLAGLFAMRAIRLPGVLRWPVMAPCLLLIGSCAIRFSLAPPPPPAHWQPAIRMATESPAGVGPGLFARFAARNTTYDAAAVLAEPANSYLALAATAGFAALAGLMLTIGLLYSSLRGPTEADSPPVIHLAPRSRLEFYLGGLLGLVVGLLLQVWDWPGGGRAPIVTIGLSTAMRAFVWFCAFAFAERAFALDLYDRRAAIGLGAALIAAMLYDVLRPGLAEVFWAAAAAIVVLAAPPLPSPWSRSGVARFLPVMAGAGLLVAIALTSVLPALESTLDFRRAVRQMPNYAAKLRGIERTTSPPGKSAAHSEAVRHIRHWIVLPLLDAMTFGDRDPTSPASDESLPERSGALPRDVTPAIVAAPWCIAAWEHGAPGNFDQLGIACSMLGQKFDAANVDGFHAEFAARLRFAVGSEKKRAEQFERIEPLVAALCERDPALEARLRFRIAAAQFAIQDKKAGFKEATTARDLDDPARGPRYRLTETERKQVDLWLASPPR